MAAHRLLEFHEYRYGPRSVLLPGDRFRVRGGPVYVSQSGAEIPMHERGVFVFHRYCIQGAARWIEAYRDGSSATVILWMGRSGRSTVEPSLRRRPYRIVGKITEQTAQKRRQR